MKIMSKKHRRSLLCCVLALVMAMSLFGCGDSAPAGGNSGSGGSGSGGESGTAAGTPSNETYRTVQVYQMDGKAEVERNFKTMSPYINMMLENEDKVSTMVESHLYARLDEDKFLLAEPESVFTLEATGDAQNSKTRIVLLSGAVVSNITQPLSETSTYEVTTPNSTMAVRGTSFRVEVTVDESGNSHTVLQVGRGSVDIDLLDEDGNSSGDKRTVNANQQVGVDGNQQDNTNTYTSGDVQDMTEEDKEKLEGTTQDFLDATDAKDLDPTLGEGEGGEEGEGSENGEGDANQPPVQPPQQPQQPATPPANQENNGDVTPPLSEEEKAIKEFGEASSGGTTTYTVTFQYNNKTFGTQRVTSGQLAKVPKLQPTAMGKWKYDFTKPVTSDITIQWSDIDEYDNDCQHEHLEYVTDETGTVMEVRCLDCNRMYTVTTDKTTAESLSGGQYYTFSKGGKTYYFWDNYVPS